jgi:ryanodine receptor 2
VRQYDSIGELIRALQKTYVINSKTKNDVAQMWVGLSQIRSLLPVQMSQEEEGLMRERLWYVPLHLLLLLLLLLTKHHAMKT